MNVAESMREKYTVLPSGCWEWTRGVDGSGYGSVRGPNQRKVGAHRLFYESLVGPIPQGLELDHLCRNRRCVNPAHLEPVTHAENMRRAVGAVNVINEAKAYCKHGHPFDEENTYIRTNGARDCRACGRERVRLYKQRKEARRVVAA